MVNYSDGKIYAIKSYQTDKIYIGSTCKSLKERFSEHKTKYKQYLKVPYGCSTSYEIIKFGDAYIELLELHPCENRTQLIRCEGKHIKNYINICVNKKIH